MKIFYKLNEYVIGTQMNAFMSFIIDGNSNIVLKPRKTMADSTLDGVHVREGIYTANFDEIDKLTTFLVENRVGTANRMGITGDITQVLSGKTRFVAMAKEEADDNTVKSDDLYVRKLIRPNKFVIFTIGSDRYYKIRLVFTINNPMSNNKSVTIEAQGIPNESITLPNTVSDGLANWFAYWFDNEAVRDRMEDKTRNRKVKFKSHHALSDVFITQDDDYNQILVVRYVNSTKTMVFVPNKDNTYSVYTGENEYFDYLKCDSNIDIDVPEEMLDRIQKYPKQFRFKAKSDKDVFTEYFIEWRRRTMKKIRVSSTYGYMVNGGML